MNKNTPLAEIFFMQLDSKSCDSRYTEVNKKIGDEDEYMTNALKDNQEILKHYTAMTDALDEYNAIETEEFYMEGFKFGFKLAMEIFEVKSLINL